MFDLQTGSAGFPLKSRDADVYILIRFKSFSGASHEKQEGLREGGSAGFSRETEKGREGGSERSLSFSHPRGTTGNNGGGSFLLPPLLLSAEKRYIG